MRVVAFTLDYPPHRFIGSELMTHALLRALRGVGHATLVRPRVGQGMWEFDGIVAIGKPSPDPAADVVVVHAGYSWPGVEYRARTGSPLVMICHNASPATRDDVEGARPDLVVVNSLSMAETLGVAALVVNPPAPTPQPPVVGDCVTTLSLNELKGGRQFWRLARRMPHVGFLAVEGGYGEQVVKPAGNVEVLKHVPHDRLDDLVWARTGVFLQLADSESWGMAAAEAIAHGLPVIAHPTPGIVENLGDAAVYVDRDDIDGLSDALRRVLADPSPHSARAQARALEHRAASAEQMAAWVTAIEGLNDGAHNKRDRAAQGALVGRR
jgi:hypothetical protein